MTTITLSDRISITDARGESVNGAPVLVIDGVAYAGRDNYGPALRTAFGLPSDEQNWLSSVYRGYQMLTEICVKTPGALKSLTAFHRSSLAPETARNEDC